MDKRYLDNPFPDYQEQSIDLDKEHVKNLISTYVNAILEHSPPLSSEDSRGDLYVGKAGIAYMFWKLARSQDARDLFPAAQHAQTYVRNAKVNALRHKKKLDERCGFLCGNAGIYAMSAAIAHDLGHEDEMLQDLKNFALGFDACLPLNFSKNGSDEFLVGRAGFLAGCYWLNETIGPPHIADHKLLKICETMLESGRQYSKAQKSPLPLMYQYHGTEYLGAAHGLCAILHMMLESPWYEDDEEVSITVKTDIKESIDYFLSLQDSEGNFPVALEDLRTGREKRLVHWCHGAPGAVYLLVKAYKIYGDKKYLQAAEKASDLVWKKGLLRKGPGICHGIAGNGYVFLLLYRVTDDDKYLYRAVKFMEFLTNSEFKARARIPDRPYSLYEGVAGTVCFLIDVIDPKRAEFPFMNIFR